MQDNDMNPDFEGDDRIGGAFADGDPFEPTFDDIAGTLGTGVANGTIVMSDAEEENFDDVFEDDPNDDDFADEYPGKKRS